jgi:hypothetical protein
MYQNHSSRRLIRLIAHVGNKKKSRGLKVIYAPGAEKWTTTLVELVTQVCPNIEREREIYFRTALTLFVIIGKGECRVGASREREARMCVFINEKHMIPQKLLSPCPHFRLTRPASCASLSIAR